MRTLIAASLSATAMAFSACAQDGGREIYWREVVRSSTGEEFVVDRREVRRRVAEPFQKASWLFQESVLSANVPGIGPLHWETSLRPWLLDRAKDGRWYLIALRGAYSSEYEYGLFDGTGKGPRFVFYRQRAGEWERILDLDLPPEFVTPNLLIFGEAILGPYANDKAKSFKDGQLLGLALKSQINVPNHNTPPWEFNLTKGWWLDHGNRHLTECVTGGPCNDECFRRVGSCKSVQRFDVGQTLGRPPKSAETTK